MTTSLVDAECILSIEIGSVNTRALLFDEADGQYHFVSAAMAPSTFTAPFSNISEGVHRALVNLQESTGRKLLDEDARLIIPVRRDGAGVDRVVITFSGGPELRIVTLGLLNDVSLESANRLAATTYSKVIESIGLNDHRRPAEQFDAILHAGPDLVILAGGTDQGATRSIAKMVELLGLVCRILPTDKRPEILYAGNRALAKRVAEMLGRVSNVHVAPNVRPSIDQEDLLPAQDLLAQVVGSIRTRSMGGLQDLSMVSGTPPIPSAQAFGRMIRFYSQINDPVKGVLGVDLGSSFSTVATAAEGQLTLNTLPLGMGAGIKYLLQNSKIEDIMQWLNADISAQTVRDYLWQKSLYPAAVPMDMESAAIEQAATRQALRLIAQRGGVRLGGAGYDPILIAGSTLTHAPTAGQALMMLLDGLQPTGVTMFYLDPHGLTSALGAIAPINSLMPVQVINSSAYINLATVITAVANASYGTPIMNVRMEDSGGNVTELEVKHGSLTVLPIPAGYTARVWLYPLRKIDVDPRMRAGSGFKIVGGVCGAVIDARGRPLSLPADAAKRREIMSRWLRALGG